MFLVGSASTYNETFYLAKNEKKTITLDLHVNQNVTGYFTITGDTFHYWEYFYFKVIDPNGVVFIDSEHYSIGEKYNFTFKALAEGKHSLIFENDAESRYVELSYQIESEASNVINFADALLWIVLGAIVIGLALAGIGFFVLRRRNRNKPPNTQL